MLFTVLYMLYAVGCVFPFCYVGSIFSFLFFKAGLSLYPWPAEPPHRAGWGKRKSQYSSYVFKNFSLECDVLRGSTGMPSPVSLAVSCPEPEKPKSRSRCHRFSWIFRHHRFILRLWCISLGLKEIVFCSHQDPYGLWPTLFYACTTNLANPSAPLQVQMKITET